MQARYYDPALGRFLNVDPAFRDLSFRLEDPQSMNSYAYARNNPIGYIDVDGRLPILVPAIMWVAAAGLATSAPLYVAGTYSYAQGNMQAGDQLFTAQQFTLGATEAGFGAAFEAAVIAGSMSIARGSQISSKAAKSNESVNWSQDKFTRGKQVDRLEGNNLGSNYPVADNMDLANGNLRSNKSMDLGAKTYQKPGNITRRINTYGDELAGFQGKRWGNVNVRKENIQSRELRLVVPKGPMSPAQQSAIDKSRSYLKGKNVNLNVKQR